MAEPRRDSQTSEADVVSCRLVYLHFGRVAMCSHAETRGGGTVHTESIHPDSREGKPRSEGSEASDRLWKQDLDIIL